MTNENANNNDENILAEGSFVITRMTLSRAFLFFATKAEETVTPEMFDRKAQWAVEHDKKWDYNAQTVLNIASKNVLDSTYKSFMAEEGSAQQVLHAMEESTPTNRDEEEVKDRTITYITTWLDLMHAFYTNFLAGVTIDEESFEDKYARVRSELIDQTNKMIIHDYVDYMKEHEEWGSEDVERFLAEDNPLAEIPESFSQSYYDDLDLLE